MKAFCTIILSVVMFTCFGQEGGNRTPNKEAKIKTETIMDLKIKPKNYSNNFL